MPDKTAGTQQPESEFDYQGERAPQHAAPLTAEELAAREVISVEAPEGLPESAHEQDDRGVTAEYAVGEGPVTGVDTPSSDTLSDENKRRAAQYSLRAQWRGDSPPESTNPLSEQEGLDGSRASVHLFQEIPGDTELKRHLLYGTIQFQHGPIAEVGVNGGTIEGVITVLQERLEGFQRGPFACVENSQAIRGLQEVLNVLALRTRRRQEQGVEGTNAPHQEV